jgi:outer membrane lipoprotein-sorting protein
MPVILLALLFLSPQQDTAGEIFQKYEAKYSSSDFILVELKGSWTVGKSREEMKTTYTGKAAIAAGDRFLLDLDFKGDLFSDRIIVRSDGKTTQTIATMESASPGGEPKVSREPQTSKTKKGVGRLMTAFFTRVGFGVVMVAVKRDDGDEDAGDPDKELVVHDFKESVKGKEGDREIVTLFYQVTYNNNFELDVKLVLDAKTLAPIRRTCSLGDDKGPGENKETHVFAESYQKVSTQKTKEELFQHEK